MQASMAEQEKRLNSAIAELRKITKGNKSGSGFNASTHGLRLPVASGKVVRYNSNTAEIVGSKGANVTLFTRARWYVFRVIKSTINMTYTSLTASIYLHTQTSRRCV